MSYMKLTIQSDLSHHILNTKAGYDFTVGYNSAFLLKFTVCNVKFYLSEIRTTDSNKQNCYFSKYNKSRVIVNINYADLLQ